MKCKSWAVVAIAVFKGICCSPHAPLPDGWYLVEGDTARVAITDGGGVLCQVVCGLNG